MKTYRFILRRQKTVHFSAWMKARRPAEVSKICNNESWVQILTRRLGWLWRISLDTTAFKPSSFIIMAMSIFCTGRVNAMEIEEYDFSVYEAKEIRDCLDLFEEENEGVSEEDPISLIQVACVKIDKRMVQILLKHNVYLNEETEYGTTLQCAIVTGSKPINTLLIEHGGADIEQPDKDGITPLIWSLMFREQLAQSDDDSDDLLADHFIALGAKKINSDHVEKIVSRDDGSFIKCMKALFTHEDYAKYRDYQTNLSDQEWINQLLEINDSEETPMNEEPEDQAKKKRRRRKNKR